MTLSSYRQSCKHQLLSKNPGTDVSHGTCNPGHPAPRTALHPHPRPRPHCLICDWENRPAGDNGPRAAMTSSLGTRLADLCKHPAGSGSSLILIVLRVLGKPYLALTDMYRIYSSHTCMMPWRIQQVFSEGHVPLDDELNAHHGALPMRDAQKYVVQDCARKRRSRVILAALYSYADHGAMSEFTISAFFFSPFSLRFLPHYCMLSG